MYNGDGVWQLFIVVGEFALSGFRTSSHHDSSLDLYAQFVYRLDCS